MPPRQPQMWRPNPDAVREGYEWQGDLEVLPVLWRNDPHLELMRDRTLRVLTTHGYARVFIGDYIAKNLAGGFYPVPRAEWLAGYLPVDGKAQ